MVGGWGTNIDTAEKYGWQSEVLIVMLQKKRHGRGIMAPILMLQQKRWSANWGGNIDAAEIRNMVGELNGANTDDAKKIVG